MIRVFSVLDEKPTELDADAGVIADNGALVIYKDADATITLCAYAPGIWAAFQILEDE